MAMAASSYAVPMHETVHAPSLPPQTLDPGQTDEAARTSAVATWWQLTTFVEVVGRDAAVFLDAITSQDVAGTAPGTARHALFLTNKARIVAPVLLYRAADDRVLLEMDPAVQESLVAHLRRYRLRAKVEVGPVDVGAVSIVGASAKEVAPSDAAGWYDSPAWGAPARTFLGTREDAAELVARLSGDGAGLADPEALDALRIEHGTPSLADLLVGAMPAEVGGVEVGVSLTKGCYLGQEPVARLHYRGHPNRTLRQVRLDRELPGDYFESREQDAPEYLALEREPGQVAGGGRALGTLTSWAASPRHGLIGLAVLRREVEDGQPLLLAGTPVGVTPVQLPG